MAKKPNKLITVYKKFLKLLTDKEYGDGVRVSEFLHSSIDLSGDYRIAKMADDGKDVQLEAQIHPALETKVFGTIVF